MPRTRTIGLTLALGLVASACGSTTIDSTEGPAPVTVATVELQTVEGEIVLERDPDVPDLPFDDNPDPNQCGIPTPWGPNGQAWLSGTWEGELIQPDVLLYDSHARLEITGEGPHGTEIQILLYQPNPVLDFYLVKVPETGDEGWVPAPFLSFDPVV